jgi:hypothetical protein
MSMGSRFGRLPIGLRGEPVSNAYVVVGAVIALLCLNQQPIPSS